MSEQHDLEVVRDLAIATTAPRTVTGPDGVVYAVIWRGQSQMLERLTPEGGLETKPPGRIRQTVELATSESLIDYAKRFRDGRSVFFADVDADKIVCVLDYHSSSRDDISLGNPDAWQATTAANFGEHVAELNLRRSLEWAAWSKADGAMVQQLDFVRFLDDNRDDIISPDAGTVIDACRDLQSLRRVKFNAVARLDSDNVSIEFDDETTATARQIDMPASFLVRMPVYFEGETVDIEAALRWRVEDGKLLLGLRLKRAERVRQAMFRQVVGEIAEATGVQALYGRRLVR